MSKQTSQRDRRMECMVDEELSVKLWRSIFALGKLICLTGGDLDCPRVLRVGDLLIFLLTFFTP